MKCSGCYILFTLMVPFSVHRSKNCSTCYIYGGYMATLNKYEALIILGILVVDIACTYFIYKEYEIMRKSEGR